MNKQLNKRFDKILGQASDAHITVALDWLSVLFIDTKKFVPEPGSIDTRIVNERISLYYTGKGTEHYKYMYHVLWDGEYLATLLSHTRNERFVKEGVVKVDFKNHLLYSTDLWPVYAGIVDAFQLEYKNISRLDIAMDGMNYMCEFLNEYSKQKPNQTVVQRVARGRLGASVFDEKTKKFQSFKIGAPSGQKFLTMYNKSLDIVKTGKDYIQQYWKINGLVDKTINIRAEREKLKLHHTVKKKQSGEKMLLKILEVFRVEGCENIYRLELRLRGEAIKEVKDFTVEKLKSPDDLVNVVRVMVKTIFKFKKLIYKTNISMCPDVNVIPFDKFNFKHVELLPRQERGHIYKAMLTCHLIVESMYTGKTDADDYSNYGTLKNCISRFDLSKWFARKLNNDWIEKYGLLSHDMSRTDEVTTMLYNMLLELQPSEQEQFATAMETMKDEANEDYNKEQFPFSHNGIFLPGDYQPGEIEDSPF